MYPSIAYIMPGTSSSVEELENPAPRPAPTQTRSNTDQQQVMVTVEYNEDGSSGI